MTIATAGVLVFSVAPAGAGQPGGTRFVTLGDSYSAGNGTTGAKRDECRRSDRSYGSLMASSLGYDIRDPQDFQNTACGNASTDDLINTQLDPVGPGTDVVTLTIGGNDRGVFLGAVAACGVNPVKALCEKTYKVASAFVEGELAGRLNKAYRAVDGKTGPNTRVLVGGYPHGYGDGTACPWPVPEENKDRLNDLADGIDQVIRREVGEMGDRWGYVNPDFTGHELCTRDPWMWGMEKLSDDFSGVFHPNDAGHRQYARSMLLGLRS
ncbi:SGNH/GDSL hydrolase family protein [Streptomyces sp. 5-10]|uniref:SGNH/GDSL hydrolase family protein n=1 Tax=Streptomyces sp. 5-10 TaxID=878925 RepID=UPI00168BFDF1|nr:SGNH/GDSL hydrolase family protein [Streptomyces sp. 5-10]MBD3004874.1 SGNH/GDSL hydrolase family protein [Streptomyces sp. 5-10]